MKTIGRIMGAFGLLVAVAAAQENIAVAPVPGSVDIDAAEMKAQLRDALMQATVVGVRSAVMGQAVKGAPYSATEVTENSQVLADGTHIDRKTQTSVYRDSEGRVRRETADRVTIWDPVAGVSYFLDPNTQTARRMTVGSYLYLGPMKAQVSSGAGGPNVAFVTNGLLPAGGGMMPLAPPPPPLPGAVAGPNVAVVARKAQALAGKSESLGSETVNGINATGTRVASTIEAGAIGNDRPIQIVSESWYSPELQTVVKSSHTDPRMGQETFELSNINRSEPGAELFQVPAGYEITSQK